MADSPPLYEFTEWLSNEYDTNGSTARSGALGDYFFKRDDDTEYLFEWNGDTWEELGIIEFESKHKARKAHRELCDSKNREVGWKPEEFVKKYN